MSQLVITSVSSSNWFVFTSVTCAIGNSTAVDFDYDRCRTLGIGIALLVGNRIPFDDNLIDVTINRVTTVSLSGVNR